MPETKDPRDILADHYEANPESYTPNVYFDLGHLCDSYHTGNLPPRLDAIPGCCPVGGLLILGTLSADVRDWRAVRHHPYRISDEFFSATPNEGWPERKDAIRMLRDRTYPFDDNTLGIED